MLKYYNPKRHNNCPKCVSWAFLPRSIHWYDLCARRKTKKYCKKAGKEICYGKLAQITRQILY